MFCESSIVLRRLQTPNNLKTNYCAEYHDTEIATPLPRNSEVTLWKCTLKFCFSVISFQNDRSNCKQQLQHSRFQATYFCFEKLVYEFWSRPRRDNDWEGKFLFDGWFPAVFRQFLLLNDANLYLAFTNSRKMMDKCLDNWRLHWTQSHPRQIWSMKTIAYYFNFLINKISVSYYWNYLLSDSHTRTVISDAVAFKSAWSVSVSKPCLSQCRPAASKNKVFQPYRDSLATFKKDRLNVTELQTGSPNKRD